jgi:hypothetical protein
LNARRTLLLLVLLTSLIRIVFAAATGLGVDESYVVSAGRELSLGYFDHPPASWWLSWGAAHLFGSEAPVVVRLPFIGLFALSTWLMAVLGRTVADERAGVWAALLLNLSPVFGITTGSWVLPDGPLDCALIGAALCLVRALPMRGRGAWLWWAGAGVCAGLALFSKYSAGLTIAGALLYLVTSRPHRHWLCRPEPYAAALLALAVFAPVLVWNATHGWASFAFQGGRAAGIRIHPLAPFATLAGEALFVLPWIWLPMMALFLAAIRRGSTSWQSWLLACLAAPPILLFAMVSAWSGQRVLFHWAAPGYLMLFPLLGQAAAARAGDAWVRRTTVATAGLVLFAVALLGTQLRFDWLGDSLTALTRKDPTIEGVDWTSLRSDLTERGLLRPGVVVGAPNWRDAGKIAYGIGPQTTVLCLNHDDRQFGIAFPPGAFVGHDVLLLVPEHADRVAADLRTFFTDIRPLAPVSVRIRGRVLQEVAVFQADGLRAWP